MQFVIVRNDGARCNDWTTNHFTHNFNFNFSFCPLPLPQSIPQQTCIYLLTFFPLLPSTSLHAANPAGEVEAEAYAVIGERLGQPGRVGWREGCGTEGEDEEESGAPGGGHQGRLRSLASHAGRTQRPQGSRPHVAHLLRQCAGCRRPGVRGGWGMGVAWNGAWGSGKGVVEGFWWVLSC